MGIRQNRENCGSGLLEPLFTQVQQRVLGLLFGQPRRRFRSAEVILLAQSGTGATHRLLKRLEKGGLILSTREGNQVFYQANPDAPIHGELVNLVRKSIGLVQPLQEALAPISEDIAAAFVYGSVAAGTDRGASDVDLMIIGDALDYPRVYEALQSAEGELGRSIHPSLVGRDDWLANSSADDSLFRRIREGPRLFVIGSDDVLR